MWDADDLTRHYDKRVNGLKRKTAKRAGAFLLSLVMCLSLFPVTAGAMQSLADPATITAAVAVQNYENETGENLETQRIYFQMPNGSRGPAAEQDVTIVRGIEDPETGDITYAEETVLSAGQQAPSWENEYNVIDGIHYPAIYWYEGPANCENGDFGGTGWVGYRMETADLDQGIFYTDVPVDVNWIIFNNGVCDGAAMQTPDISTQGAYEGEYDSLPYGSPDQYSFDGCIYVIDPDQMSVGASGNVIVGGNWYVYYGDGCYGAEFSEGLGKCPDYPDGTDGWTGSIDDVCMNPDHFVGGDHVGCQPLQTHTVTWKLDEDTVIDTTEVEEGERPTHADPTRAGDDTYTYTFSGWTDGENTYGPDDDLPPVTGAITYTATFDALPIPDEDPWIFEVNDGRTYDLDGKWVRFGGDDFLLTGTGEFTLTNSTTYIYQLKYGNTRIADSRETLAGAVHIGNTVYVTGRGTREHPYIFTPNIIFYDDTVTTFKKGATVSAGYENLDATAGGNHGIAVPGDGFRNVSRIQVGANNYVRFMQHDETDYQPNQVSDVLGYIGVKDGEYGTYNGSGNFTNATNHFAFESGNDTLYYVGRQAYDENWLYLFSETVSTRTNFAGVNQVICTVVWENLDGTKLKTMTYDLGDTADDGGLTPSMASPNPHYTYAFKGFEPAYAPLTDDITYVASYDLTPVPTHELIHHEAVAATAATEGNIEYWECGSCSKYFSDGDSKNEIKSGSWVTVLVDYIDEDGEEQTVEAVKLTGSMTELHGGTYAVTENVTMTDIVYMDGSVDLILCDGAILTVSPGIQVNGSGKSLTVYAQSTGEDMGILLIEEIPAGTAGIDAANGSVTINGGNIIIDSQGSGINAESGDITINGGDILINSNSESTSDSAINAKTVTINDGDITVNSTHDGISDFGDGSVTINGGVINLETKRGIYTKALTINGGSVTANATNYTLYSSGDITIRNSNVTATSNSSPIYFSGDLTISDSEINLSPYSNPKCYYGIWGSNTTSDVTIERSSLSITSCLRGINTDGNIAISGGYVSVLGNVYGIRSGSGNISLSWSTPTDSIHAYNYFAAGTVTLQKPFNNGTTVLPAGTVSDLTTIDSKTLTPPYTRCIYVSDCENGTVKAPTMAFKGDTVTLSVIPDEGYKVKSVTVNGEPLAPVEGVYSFEMPDEDVTVNAEFAFSDGMGAHLAGYTISLKGDIGVNFYMELAPEIAESQTAYMLFTIPNGSRTETRTVYVKDISPKDGYYIFKCSVAAKEMTSQIKAQIIDGEASGTEYTYSVKEYADYLLENADENGTELQKAYAKAVPLVKAMLNYGARAQLYFGQNTDSLANADLSPEEQALGDVTISADAYTAELPEGVTFSGATLSLKSETTLSLYFESSDELAFTCTGYTVEKAAVGKYQVARIRGIKAQDIGNTLTLTINGTGTGTVTYSPLNYCQNVLNNDTQSESLQDVAKALYLYWQAAKTYSA